jgi:hypothetical protein
MYFHLRAIYINKNINSWVSQVLISYIHTYFGNNTGLGSFYVLAPVIYTPVTCKGNHPSRERSGSWIPRAVEVALHQTLITNSTK